MSKTMFIFIYLACRCGIVRHAPVTDAARGALSQGLYFSRKLEIANPYNPFRHDAQWRAGWRHPSAPAALALLTTLAAPIQAEQMSSAQLEYRIGAGDILKISVFKNPDLTLEARVSEVGAISFPLVGLVQVSDLTLPAAEKKIAELLKDGGFVVNPQVNILLETAFGNQVSVLGEVNKPGRYALDAAGGHLSGMLATAGGIMPTGSDTVIVSGTS